MLGLPTSMSVPGDDVGDFLANRSNTRKYNGISNLIVQNRIYQRCYQANSFVKRRKCVFVFTMTFTKIAWHCRISWGSLLSNLIEFDYTEALVYMWWLLNRNRSATPFLQQNIDCCQHLCFNSVYVYLSKPAGKCALSAHFTDIIIPVYSLILDMNFIYIKPFLS